MLEAHLREIVTRCAQAGAHVLILSYPEATPMVDKTPRQVAAATGADWLDLRPGFAEALRSRSRTDLFIPDGHCKDQGYEVMARLVADRILKLR